MVTTEITNQSWLGRIGESIKSVLFGLVLFVASFPVLWLNEGRAVRTEKGLHEGQGAVVDASADRVDPSMNGKLVHVAGKASTAEQISDPDFGVAPAGALKLRRRAEMFQWEEEKKSETEKKTGGGSVTKTTYSYSKKWSDRLIDSSGFKESGHDNPSKMAFESRDTQAQQVTLGAYKLSDSLVGKMDDYEPVALTDQDLAKIASKEASFKVAENAFFLGEHPQDPAIGDLRVSFSVVKPGDYSVVAKQSASTFEPFPTASGYQIELLKRGIVPAQAMFLAALQQNTILTWVLRVVGFILMFIGMALVFRPISVFGDVIPLFGSLLAFGTGLFALVMSGVLSVMTIAVAWIFYRPFLGIALLAAAIAVLVWFAMRGRKKIAAAVAARPAVAAS